MLGRTGEQCWRVSLAIATDVDAARELVASTEDAELFLYPGISTTRRLQPAVLRRGGHGLLTKRALEFLQDR